MRFNKNKKIAIVGAGVIGCSCALWLQIKGFTVVLIDPARPGSGTSSGNACTIANYACVPVNSPNILKNPFALIFAKHSPLSVDFGYALGHLPWITRFLSNCRPARVARINSILGDILKKTYHGLNPLIEYCDAASLLSKQGCLHVYENEAEFRCATAANQVRRDQGVTFTELDTDSIQDLEPGIKKTFAKGLLFEQATQVLNPQALITRYFSCLVAKGGEYCAARVSAITHTNDGVCLQLDDGKALTADRVVIAAGAFSTQIQGAGTSQLPLDTERGYHVQYQGLQALLKRPVSWNSAGIYATPLDEGLRIAGTVEIAGLSPKKNPRNLNHLIRHGQQMFDLPDQPDREWLGFRPTFPDALPAIGYSPTSKSVLYAFGHQHLGLTLSGITGQLIAELINDEPLSHDIQAFNPARFG